ncbi:hypothetical protein GCM10009557_28300 [Virgisporangium ochraceum]|uniref:H+transporting two-sector ATPase D subunit n=1 Tax=Virgisporangium ochraceum TaxID=65505 RepID=A0A8J4EEA4_9ACTN|nr:V-type ATP synthase subunit D [Virgisporangium ochraceum]GIJ71544.1 hypothetical protein Voc01_064610 [Virgisporangium ochraceum]
MTLERLPPGRAGLLWLRHRLAVARRGLDLLRHKQVVLAREAERLRYSSSVTREEWRAADAAGRRLLLWAAVVGGAYAVRTARPVGPAVVTPTWITVIGVRCPGDPVVRLPAPDGAGATRSPLVDAAAGDYRRALTAAARHAAMAAAVAAVEAEIATTRQRVHALERRWIPRLEDAAKGVRLQMTELEDSDAVRRRRARRDA